MRELRRKIVRRWKLIIAIALIVPVLILLRARSSPGPALIFTLSPASGASGGSGGDSAAMALASLELDAPGAQPRLVLRGFASIGKPAVSFDGSRALFAGRRAAGDPMEVWEASLERSAARPVVRGGECLDPAYLPDGRIVYGRIVAGAGPDARAVLHTCALDGQGERRITFGEARDASPVALPDGRVAFRRKLFSPGAAGRIFAMNPDGTGLQLFCDPAADASIVGGPWVAGERVFFSEETPGGQRLVSVSARAPLGGRELMASGVPDGVDQHFSSVSTLPEGGIVASARAGSKEWTLRRIARACPQGGEIVLGAVSVAGAGDFQPTAAALAVPVERPLALTSVVDERKSTGTLLCLDVHASSVPAVAIAKRGTYHTVRVLAAEGLKVVEALIESDGSFAIEVPADQPLRLQLLGPGGAQVEDPSLFWVRPNENRGCIGCHEDPEASPENRVPLALERGAAQGEARNGSALTPPAGTTPVAAAGTRGGF